MEIKTYNSNHEAFKRIRWVLQAICKDTTRSNLCYLYVDMCMRNGLKRMTCTTGKFLLSGVAPDDMEDGFYKVVVNKANEIVLQHDNDVGFNYPNIDLLIPKDVPNHEDTDTPAKYLRFDPGTKPVPTYKGTSKTASTSSTMCKIIQKYSSPACFDFSYLQIVLKDLLVTKVILKLCDTDDEYGDPDPMAPIYFSGEETFAVIMPMRAEN